MSGIQLLDENLKWPVDMHSVYLQALNSPKRNPDFMVIYEIYKDRTLELKLGHDMNSMLELPHENIIIEDELKVLDYYAKNHYFLALNDVLNPQ